MTPEERAKELIDKFIAVGCLFANAKACTLIFVEEMLRVCPIIDQYQSAFREEDEEMWETYWQKVKSEIENL